MKKNINRGLIILLFTLVSTPALSLNIQQQHDLSATIETKKLEFKIGDTFSVYFTGSEEINPDNEHVSGTMVPYSREVAKGIILEVINPGKYVAQLDSIVHPDSNRLALKKSK